MKKLSKLKLHDVAILNDGEMKCITGGYGQGSGYGYSSDVSDSPLCAEGERLFECFINFDGVCDLGSSYSLGAVCAKGTWEAMRKSSAQLGAMGIQGYAQTCR